MTINVFCAAAPPWIFTTLFIVRAIARIVQMCGKQKTWFRYVLIATGIATNDQKKCDASYWKEWPSYITTITIANCLHNI